MPSNSALFPRNFRKSYPVAVRGEGCWITDQAGRRFLDASGQAAVVSIGHGVPEIGRAMAEQSSQLAFAHTTQFHSAPAEKLAQRLLALAPSNFRNGGRVYFTSGGSEATETAIKLARQFHLESGQPARFRVVSRCQSYHGSTLGAMTVSGNVARRAPYQPLLAEWGHIAPCFCNHCPFDKKFPECGIACADDLCHFLETNDSLTVAAFIFEPVVGATLGAAVPPDGYVQRIAEICRSRGILLIADEIMSGMGRTGKPFAIQHWNVEPDIILVGKGIASGYARSVASSSPRTLSKVSNAAPALSSTASPIKHIPSLPPPATPSSITSNRTISSIACSPPQKFFAPNYPCCNLIHMWATFVDWACSSASNS